LQIHRARVSGRLRVSEDIARVIPIASFESNTIIRKCRASRVASPGTRLTDFPLFFTITVTNTQSAPNTITFILIYHTQTHITMVETSNKRQRMESPVEYTPYDAPDSPRPTSLSEQSWTPYEVNPTEAQIAEAVDKLSEPDVKILLLQSIKDLDESDARKLLINAAVSTPYIYIDIWSALTDVHMLRMDEKMNKIQERISPLVRSVPQAQQTQQVKPVRKTQEQLHLPFKIAPQVHQAQQTTLFHQPRHSAVHTPRTLDINAHVREVDYIINEKYSGLSNWKQYDKSGDAANLVDKEIVQLSRRVTKESHHDAKINAILGLCKIGILIFRGGNPVADEVCQQVGNDGLLVRTMLGIADLMTIKEKRSLNNVDIKALKAFDEGRKRQGVFSDFQKVVDTFREA
jgi:hypothetical protein